MRMTRSVGSWWLFAFTLVGCEPGAHHGGVDLSAADLSVADLAGFDLSGAVDGASADMTAPGPKLIVFDSQRALDGSDALAASQGYNLWTIEPDGTGLAPLTRLTTPYIDLLRPRFSPDGSKIAFHSGRALDGSDALNTVDNIWVMNANGSGATPLTHLTATNCDSQIPRWSPDGSMIVFQSAGAFDGSDAPNGPDGGTRGLTNVWIMNADGGGKKPLTQYIHAVASAASFSHDGTRIVYTSQAALNGDDVIGPANLWVMNADGSSKQPLTAYTTNVGSGNPSWSPDDKTIVYTSSGKLDGSDTPSTPSIANLWSVSVATQVKAPLTQLTTARSDVAVYSPDGKKIAFSSEGALNGSDAQNGTHDANLWVMNADGSMKTPLTQLTKVDYDFISAVLWSPDGSQILYSSQRAIDGSDSPGPNNTTNLWLLNADGSSPRPLTKTTADSADNEDPDWQR
jgi:Tol biopolymer transport system component